MNKLLFLLSVFACSAVAQVAVEAAVDTNSMTPMQKKYYYEELKLLREAQPALNEPIKATEPVVPLSVVEIPAVDSQKSVSAEPAVQVAPTDTVKSIVQDTPREIIEEARPSVDSVPAQIVIKPKNDLEDLEDLAAKSSLAVKESAERQRKAKEAALAANPPKSHTGLIIGSIASVVGAGALAYAVILDGEVDKLNQEYQDQLDPFQFSTQKSNIEEKASSRDLVGGIGLGLFVGGITVAIAF